MTTYGDYAVLTLAVAVLLWLLADSIGGLL